LGRQQAVPIPQVLDLRVALHWIGECVLIEPATESRFIPGTIDLDACYHDGAL
jgi:hypothetical protein